MKKIRTFKVRIRRTKEVPCPDCQGRSAKKLWRLMRGKTITVSDAKYNCTQWCDVGEYLRVDDPAILRMHERVYSKLGIYGSYEFFICGHIYLPVKK